MPETRPGLLKRTGSAGSNKPFDYKTKKKTIKPQLPKLSLKRLASPSVMKVNSVRSTPQVQGKKSPKSTLKSIIGS